MIALMKTGLGLLGACVNQACVAVIIWVSRLDLLAVESEEFLQRYDSQGSRMHLLYHSLLMFMEVFCLNVVSWVEVSSSEAFSTGVFLCFK